MTSHDASEHDDASMRRLISELERTCSSTLPEHRRADIALVLAQKARQHSTRRRSRRFLRPLRSLSLLPARLDRGHRHPARARWVPGVAAVVLALTGLGAFLQLHAPENVSAAQVLHRARLALVNGDTSEVIHEVSVIVITPNAHGQTVGVPWLGDTPDGRFVPAVVEDSWMQLTDDHTIARLDATAEDSSGRIRFHVVGSGTRGMSYDAAEGSVVVFPWRRPAVFLTSRPYGVGLATNLPLPVAVVQELLRGKQPQLAPGDTARLVGQQSLQGDQVDVVQVVHPVLYDSATGPAAWRQIFTYYVDTESYAVRRTVVKNVDDLGHTLGTSVTQLVKYERIPASRLPASVFTFTAPPGTCLYTELPYRLPDSGSPACLPKPRPASVLQ